MNGSQNNPPESALVQFARSLGGSRSGQVVVALAVVAFWCWLGYESWHHRDLAGRLLTLGLVCYGLSTAWRLLPISSGTRARWVREQQIAGRCSACQWRFLLWFGIGSAMMEGWRYWFGAGIDPYEFIFPAICIVIGVISSILCRRFIRHANDRNASSDPAANDSGRH